MRRLDRYLLGEMLLPFFGGVFLILVMLIGNTLYALIELIAKNNIPFPVVAKLVVFNIPTVFVLGLPAGTAVAAAWAVNRLARDSEVTALRMAGVPLHRIFRPIFGVGVVVSLVSFYVGNWVVPAAQREFQKTQGQMFAYALQASPAIAADRVFTFQDYAFHIGAVRRDPTAPDRLLLDRVTIYQNPPTGQGFPVLTTARSATYDHDIWTLNDAVIHILNANGEETYELTGKTTRLNLGVPLTSLAASATESPDSLNLSQLKTQMQALAETGQRGTDSYNTIAVNYYSKLSLPFICLAFALCAPPLALRFARNGPYIGIFLSIVLVWVAWNTLLLTKYLGLAGRIPPITAAWAPDLLFMGIGLLLLRRME